MAIPATDQEDDVAQKVPDWAKPPRGQGAAQSLRASLAETLVQAWSGPRPDGIKAAKSWAALVNLLLRADERQARPLIERVLADFRRKYTKLYTLD